MLQSRLRGHEVRNKANMFNNRRFQVAIEFIHCNHSAVAP